MDNILYVDTAMNACVAALKCGDKLYSRFEPQVRGQAERLMPMCEELFDEAQISPKSLHAIAVTIGPGAFTGLRVGMSAARIMALSLDIPVIGVTTCELIAADALKIQNEDHSALNSIAVILETKRSDFYFAHYKYEDLDVLQEPRALSADQVSEYLCSHKGVLYIGDALARYFDGAEEGHSSNSIIAPNPTHALEYIVRKYKDCCADDFTNIPRYLREADVSVSKTIRSIET
jgi:tRNA threonylcarbamoyladenosine biosynthesis protein TsaB